MMDSSADDYALNSINGRMQALTMTLSAVIAALPQSAAADAAAALLSSQIHERIEDEGSSSPQPPEYRLNRDAVVDAFIAQLMTASRSNG